MIGVILWSDPSDQKAVIWCEDHGDLAYISRPGPVAAPKRFVDVGDVVEFDLKAETTDHRVAQNIRLLSDAGATTLVDDLRAAPMAAAPQPPRTAEVIPFRLQDARPSAQHQTGYKRQG